MDASHDMSLTMQKCEFCKCEIDRCECVKTDKWHDYALVKPAEGQSCLILRHQILNAKYMPKHMPNDADPWLVVYKDHPVTISWIPINPDGPLKLEDSQ